jgi:hypothetical protein
LILFVPFLAMQTYFSDDNKFFIKHATLLILSKYSEKNNFASCIQSGGWINRPASGEI